MTIIDANGVQGLVCRSMSGQHFFRVYDYGTEPPTFVDYDILHHDLSVTIRDTDARFYHREDGSRTLDHSPQTIFGV
jgi:hypothetical protein